MNRFLSLNLWVAIFSALAVVGIVLAIVGTTANVPWVKTTGFVLISPIVIGGVLLVLIGFPILIIANRKHSQPDNNHYDEQSVRVEKD